MPPDTPPPLEILTHIQLVTPNLNKFTSLVDGPASEDRDGTHGNLKPSLMPSTEVSFRYLENPGCQAFFDLEATLGTAIWTPGQMHSRDS